MESRRHNATTESMMSPPKVIFKHLFSSSSTLLSFPSKDTNIKRHFVGKRKQQTRDLVTQSSTTWNKTRCLKNYKCHTFTAEKTQWTKILIPSPPRRNDADLIVNRIGGGLIARAF